MLNPIPASEFLSWPVRGREIMQKHGRAIAVNDIFMPLWEKNPKVWILRGGRGGGKSEAVADRLIEDCISEKYAKIYYGRKVFDTVRGSCFETIAVSIKKMGLSHEFHYSDAQSSPMIFTHLPTGNKFIPFGSDKPEKLKSIKDPTHIWCEEFPEFEFNDFKELLPTLRTIKGKKQFIGTMNAYSIYSDDWIIKVFFPDEYTGEDKMAFDILEGIDVQAIIANYYDNYFINQQEYERDLRLASGGNQSIFDGLAHGALGVIENNNPWFYDFNENKHVVDNIPFLPSFEVHLSFDFNNDPFACTAWQMSPNKGGKDSFVHGIKEFSGHFKLEEMCERISTTFPYSIFRITGDRSGSNEDIGRNQTLYQIIGSKLGVNEKLMDTFTKNLEHADSRILMNTMFYHYPNIKLSRQGMPIFIKQCGAAMVDIENRNPSQLLKDRKHNKNDEFDSGRYFFQAYFNDFAKNTYFRALKKR